MSVNLVWHDENPMPERPCRMVRVLWHARHALACGCRAVPQSIRDDVEAELVRIRSTEASELLGYGQHASVRWRLAKS